MNRFIPSRTAVILTCLGCVLAVGCMGYRVGPVLKADYRSVAVPMFKNKTYKPQLEAQITNGIIKRLQADGTLQADSEANADIVVTGEIIRYDRLALRLAQEDANVPREYRLTITVRVEAHDRRTGTVVLKPTDITGKADMFIGTDQQSAEYQALPLVADDVARQVVSLLVESW
ncbi:MAG: LptE family protein [Verrucomicrobiia bacterium]